ncbi:hypothetical protein PFISCL1PPCAC_23132, partial [Pristionchus fissidentatus]
STCSCSSRYGWPSTFVLPMESTMTVAAEAPYWQTSWLTNLASSGSHSSHLTPHDLSAHVQCPPGKQTASIGSVSADLFARCTIDRKGEDTVPALACRRLGT